MHEIKALTSRNIKIFLRDKTAVFFSFLSIIILLALYFLFIGRQYTQGMEEISESLQTYLVTSQMMGGVLIINTISLSLGIMGNLIVDLEQHLLEGFLVTPVKRSKIILSYFLSSVIVTTALTLIMWVLTIFYVGIFSGYWYSVSTILVVSLILIVSTFISAALMIYLTTLLKSVNAFGTMSGVLGTFVGFVSGIYMPLIVLGDSMRYVASLVPFTHLTILLKQTLLKHPYELLAAEVAGAPESEAILANIKAAYGTNEIGLLGQNVAVTILIGIFLALSAVFLYLAFKKMTKRIANI